MLRFVLLGILLVPLGAGAQELREVGIVGMHRGDLDDSGQRVAVDAMIAAIESTGSFNGLDEEEMARKILGREALIVQETFLGPGRRMLEDGRILYEQANTTEAIPVLQEAIATLRAGMATANSTRDLWEAWVYLGTAQVAEEDEASARVSFAHAVTLNRLRNPNPTRFPPNVVALFEQVRVRQLAQVSQVSITADSGNVIVYINGKEVGSTPKMVQGLPPGENHVVGRGADGRYGYAQIDLPPSSLQTVELHMQTPTLGVTGTESKLARARQAAALYRALGIHSNVDFLLLTGVADDRLYLQVYSPDTDAFTTPLAVPFQDDSLDEAVQAISTVLTMFQVDGSMKLDETALNAVPVDISANRLLAQMLLNPAPIVYDARSKAKSGIR
jgi:hypothetical protein